MPQTRDIPKQEPLPLSLAIPTLLSNRPFVTMLLVVAATTFFIPTVSKMGVYYAKVVLGDVSLASGLLFSFAAGQIFSLPLWTLLSHRFEKRTIGQLANCCIILTAIALAIAAPTDTIPANFIFGAFGFFTAAIYTLNWAILPDTVEYGESKFGIRNEALTFGIFLLVIKATDGANSGAIGWLLEIAGYGKVDAPAELGRDIILIMSVPTIVGAAICILALQFYSITHDSHSRLSFTPD